MAGGRRLKLPITFPLDPQDASPEQKKYYQQLREYIERVEDYLQVNLKTIGVGAGTGVGGNVYDAGNATFLPGGTPNHLTITMNKDLATDDIIIVTYHAGLYTTVGALNVTLRSPGTPGQFRVTSSSATDNNNVDWIVIRFP